MHEHPFRGQLVADVGAAFRRNVDEPRTIRRQDDLGRRDGRAGFGGLARTGRVRGRRRRLRNGARRIDGRQIPVGRHAVVASAHQAVVIAIERDRAGAGPEARRSRIQAKGVRRGGAAVDRFHQADALHCLPAGSARIQDAHAGHARGGSTVDHQLIGRRTIVAQPGVHDEGAAARIVVDRKRLEAGSGVRRDETDGASVVQRAQR
ncbi:hypothetical protein D3C85_1188670 [compost metagenome]